MSVCLSGPVWSGLVWSGPVWSGLVRSGPVWSSLVWSGPSVPIEFPRKYISTVRTLVLLSIDSTAERFKVCRPSSVVVVRTY